jgi:hypothetical protein
MLVENGSQFVFVLSVIDQLFILKHSALALL